MNSTFHPELREYKSLVKGYIENDKEQLEYTDESLSQNPTAIAFEGASLIQWGQTGYAPGFASMNFYFPQNKTGVIVLENVNYDVSQIKKTFHYHIQILDIVQENNK